jgi:hypothetical protein
MSEAFFSKEARCRAICPTLVASNNYEVFPGFHCKQPAIRKVQLSALIISLHYSLKELECSRSPYITL